MYHLYKLKCSLLSVLRTISNFQSTQGILQNSDYALFCCNMYFSQTIQFHAFIVYLNREGIWCINIYKITFIVVLGKRIENTAFSYKSASSLLAFPFSPNSFYSGFSCTILLLFFHIHPWKTIYTVGREAGTTEGKKRPCKGFFSPVPLKCFHTDFTC